MQNVVTVANDVGREWIDFGLQIMKHELDTLAHLSRLGCQHFVKSI
jgi:hypothetical protein